MPTGGFAGVMVNTTSGNAGANILFVTQVTAQQSGVATAVLLDIVTATSGFNFRAVVYDGSHNTLLASGPVVTSLVAGYNRFPLTASLSVTAGTVYYVGYVSDGGVTVSVGTLTGSSSWYVASGISAATPPNPVVGGSSQTNCLTTALEYDGTGTQGYGYSVDQSPGVVLSASHTVATFPATANQGARSLVTAAHGASSKYYAEVAVSGTTIRTDDAVGLNIVAWNPSQPAPGNLAFVLQASGTVLAGFSSPNIGLTWTSGDVIGIAFDPADYSLWWNKNNGSWFGASSTAGNPTTNTGGLTLVSASSWPMAVSVMSQTAGSSVAFTLHDQASTQQYSPPSGYAAWSPPTVAAASQARVMVLA